MNKYNRMVKISLLLILGWLLSSCTLLTPAPAFDPTLYTLNPSSITGPQAIKGKSAGQLSILVLAPVANPEIDTNKMAYAKANHQIAYLSKNRWASSPAQMLLPLITQALRKSGHFFAVVPA